MFKPGHLYSLTALVGCILFVTLSHRYGIATERAAWVSIFLVIALRLASIRFNWTTHALKDVIGLGDDQKKP